MLSEHDQAILENLLLDDYVWGPFEKLPTLVAEELALYGAACTREFYETTASRTQVQIRTHLNFGAAEFFDGAFMAVALSAHPDGRIMTAVTLERAGQETPFGIMLSLSPPVDNWRTAEEPLAALIEAARQNDFAKSDDWWKSAVKDGVKDIWQRINP